MAGISFHEVTKRFGDVVAVDDLTLDIEDRELLVLLGPSGCGKSTLLNLIAGLDVADEGEIVLDGISLTGKDANELARLRRTHVGIVFQFFNLVEGMSARENVTLAALVAGSPRRVAEPRAEDLLDLLGLLDKADKAPAALSGGQRQRLAIARALVNRPTLLLADEPTGALDTQTGDRVMDLFTTLAEGGAAVLVVTHEPRVAGFADRVVTLRDGRVVSDTATRSSRPPAGEARRPDRDPWAPAPDGPDPDPSRGPDHTDSSTVAS